MILGLEVTQIPQAILGLVLALFLPGSLLTRLFFEECDLIERIGLGMVLSICVDIGVGLFLGYNETMKNLTGGITAQNVWTALISITLVLLIGIGIKRKKKKIRKLLLFSPEE